MAFPPFPPPPVRRHDAPCEAGTAGPAAHRGQCRGASLPNVIHWGWRGAPAPSNPRPGGALPWPPPITPAAPFSLSLDGGLDGAKKRRGSLRPQRRGLRRLREKRWGGGEVTRHPCAPPGLFGWRVGPTPPPCPPEADIVDHFPAVGGRRILLHLVDLLHGHIEAPWCSTISQSASARA